MQKDKELTVVVFRRWRGTQAVIALFPGEDAGGGLCSSYEHVGQHGAADYRGVIAKTLPAKPPEYRDLMLELEDRGYNLRPLVRKPGGGWGSRARVRK